MRFRHQPPVNSPVSLAGLLAGAGAAVGVGPKYQDALRVLLQARFDARAVRLYDCGTSALRRAMQIASPGGKSGIAVPAWACYDIVSAAVGAGARIVFYDCDPATLQPREDSLKAASALGISGVVIVHAYGVPVDVAAVRRCVGASVVVIEDAAQAWGGWSGNRPLGALGDLSVFSFGRGKGITGGGGGALAVRSEQLEDNASMSQATPGVSQLVNAAALLLLSRPMLYAAPASLTWLKLGETVYRPPHSPGPMARASAALIMRSLDEADEEATRRRSIADRLRSAVANGPKLRNVRISPGERPGWLRLPVLAAEAGHAKTLVRQGRQLGMAAAYPQDLASLARSLSADFEVCGALDGASELAARLVTYPCHRRLSETDLVGLERLAAL